MVDSAAFKDLRLLRSLQLRDSRNLLFVSGEALSSVAALHTLDLSGNPRLKVAPLADWLAAAPNLTSVRLRGCGSLRCACTSAAAAAAAATPDWQAGGNGTAATCRDHRGHLVSILKSADKSACSSEPLILPMFPKRVHVSEGRNLRLPCRVYPSRGAQLRWRLPPGLSTKSDRHRVHQTANGDLVLRDVVRALSGMYWCSASFRDGGRSPAAHVMVKVSALHATYRHKWLQPLSRTHKRFRIARSILHAPLMLFSRSCR